MTEEHEAKTTADQVQQAVEEHGIRRWMLRRCSICDSPLTYAFNGQHVTFDSNCDCSSWSSDPRPSSYQDVANTLNMQTPDVRARMWRSLLGGEHHDG